VGEDKLNASGFEFYEGIRIAIPGALALSLYVGINSTFHLGAPKPNALLGIIVAFAFGLVLYFVDASGRAQIYAAAQPHRVIESWNMKPPPGVSFQNAYFVVLDSVMPAGIRNRALYFGSIFRIGFESIYVSALGSIGVLTAATVCTSTHALRGTDTTVLWLAVPFHCLAAGLGIGEGYALARRRAHGQATEALRQLTRLFTLQIGRGGLLVCLIAAVAVLVYFWCAREPALLALAVAALAGLWASRYLLGYRREDGSRRNVDVSTAAVLLTATVLLATVLAATQLPKQSVVGTGAALGWSAVALVAEILLSRRGHERKLWAAYHTQKAWFELNRDAVVKAAGLTAPADTPTNLEPEPPTS
jgi:hypothetical protein